MEETKEKKYTLLWIFSILFLLFLAWTADKAFGATQELIFDSGTNGYYIESGSWCGSGTYTGEGCYYFFRSDINLDGVGAQYTLISDGAGYGSARNRTILQASDYYAVDDDIFFLDNPYNEGITKFRIGGGTTEIQEGASTLQISITGGLANPPYYPEPLEELDPLSALWIEFDDEAGNIATSTDWENPTELANTDFILADDKERYLPVNFEWSGEEFGDYWVQLGMIPITAEGDTASTSAKNIMCNFTENYHAPMVIGDSATCYVNLKEIRSNLVWVIYFRLWFNDDDGVFDPANVALSSQDRYIWITQNEYDFTITTDNPYASSTQRNPWTKEGSTATTSPWYVDCSAYEDISIFEAGTWDMLACQMEKTAKQIGSFLFEPSEWSSNMWEGTIADLEGTFPFNAFLNTAGFYQNALGSASTTSASIDDLSWNFEMGSRSVTIPILSSTTLEEGIGEENAQSTNTLIQTLIWLGVGAIVVASIF